MTAKRRYNAQCHDCKVDAICPKCNKPVSPVTEFSDWSREQTEISSEKGFTPSNVDFLWRNYKSGKWMLLEEKRYSANLKRWQKELFLVLHNSIKDNNYKGFYIVQFEKTSPDDGGITIISLATGKRTEVDRSEFLAFLRMDW